MGEPTSHYHDEPYKKIKHKVEEEENDQQPKTSLSFVFSCFSLCPRITLALE